MGHFARKDHGRNAAQQTGTISTDVFAATHQPALLFTAGRREEPEKWEQGELAAEMEKGEQDNRR